MNVQIQRSTMISGTSKPDASSGSSFLIWCRCARTERQRYINFSLYWFQFFRHPATAVCVSMDTPEMYRHFLKKEIDEKRREEKTRKRRKKKRKKKKQKKKQKKMQKRFTSQLALSASSTLSALSTPLTPSALSTPSVSSVPTASYALPLSAPVGSVASVALSYFSVAG